MNSPLLQQKHTRVSSCHTQYEAVCEKVQWKEEETDDRDELCVCVEPLRVTHKAVVQCDCILRAVLFWCSASTMTSSNNSN